MVFGAVGRDLNLVVEGLAVLPDHPDGVQVVGALEVGADPRVGLVDLGGPAGGRGVAVEGLVGGEVGGLGGARGRGLALGDVLAGDLGLLGLLDLGPLGSKRHVGVAVKDGLGRHLSLAEEPAGKLVAVARRGRQHAVLLALGDGHGGGLDRALASVKGNGKGLRLGSGLRIGTLETNLGSGHELLVIAHALPRSNAPEPEVRSGDRLKLNNADILVRAVGPLARRGNLPVASVVAVEHLILGDRSVVGAASAGGLTRQVAQGRDGRRLVKLHLNPEVILISVVPVSAPEGLLVAVKGIAERALVSGSRSLLAAGGHRHLRRIDPVVHLVHGHAVVRLADKNAGLAGGNRGERDVGGRATRHDLCGLGGLVGRGGARVEHVVAAVVCLEGDEVLAAQVGEVAHLDVAGNLGAGGLVARDGTIEQRGAVAHPVGVVVEAVHAVKLQGVLVEEEVGAGGVPQVDGAGIVALGDRDLVDAGRLDREAGGALGGIEVDRGTARVRGGDVVVLAARRERELAVAQVDLLAVVDARGAADPGKGLVLRALFDGDGGHRGVKGANVRVGVVAGGVVDRLAGLALVKDNGALGVVQVGLVAHELLGSDDNEGLLGAGALVEQADGAVVGLVVELGQAGVGVVVGVVVDRVAVLPLHRVLGIVVDKAHVELAALAIAGVGCGGDDNNVAPVDLLTELDGRELVVVALGKAGVHGGARNPGAVLQRVVGVVERGVAVTIELADGGVIDLNDGGLAGPVAARVGRHGGGAAPDAVLAGPDDASLLLAGGVLPAQMMPASCLPEVYS